MFLSLSHLYLKKESFRHFILCNKYNIIIEKTIQKRRANIKFAVQLNKWLEKLSCERFLFDKVYFSINLLNLMTKFKFIRSTNKKTNYLLIYINSLCFNLLKDTIKQKNRLFSTIHSLRMKNMKLREIMFATIFYL